MKKLFMVIVCLMTIVFSVNAQGWSLQAKQNAVNIIRCRLKAPSTFILTDYYGNKIPVSKISATYMGEKIEYDSVYYGKDASVVDSIEYVFDNNTGILVDSLVYTSYKTIGIDSIIYYKRVYFPCYKCSFFYEAQNSYGGMTRGSAKVYVTKDTFVSKFLDYDSRLFKEYKIGKKVVCRPVPTPPIKKVKSYISAKCPNVSDIDAWLKISRNLSKGMSNQSHRDKDRRHIDDVYF